MVMTADSPTNDHSPRSPVTGTSTTSAAAVGGGVNSPQSRRRSLPSPWASVVRGDSDPISSPTAVASHSSTSPPPIVAAVPEQPSASAPEKGAPMESSGPESHSESSDVNTDNAGRPRRHAWNTPVNGVVEHGSVMGDAVSWPALSESTRPVPRSSSDTSRPSPDGSTSSQGPIISQPPQRQANNNAHVNSTANNMPARQRSRHRSGGAGGAHPSGSGPSSSAFSRPSPPPPPQFPLYEMPYGTVVPAMLDAPMRGTRPGGGVGGSQSHAGNDHPSPRNNSRRGNYGPRPRGDGAYHSNHGGRRDQDRRDHIPPQFVHPPVGYMPTPLPPGAPFIAPPVRVFPGQMGFDMSSPFLYVPTLPPESFRPMPMVPPPPPPMLFPAESALPNMIVKQIDYYFSDDNLVKDDFLRSNMNDHGWVPITLIANFPRVQQLTYDIPLILDSLRNSTVVEVQGDKLRRREEWKKWIKTANWSNTDSGSQPSGASPENVLTTSFQKVLLDDATVDANGTMYGQSEMSSGMHTSDEMTAMSKLPNGENTAEDIRSTNI